MTIKEAYEIIEKKIGKDEESIKALKVLKDNLNLNQYVSTDIVENHYANARFNLHGFDVGDLKYEDYLAIAEKTVYYISQQCIIGDITDALYDAIGEFVDEKEGEKND